MVIEKEPLPPILLKMLALATGVRVKDPEFKKDKPFVISLQPGLQTLLKLPVENQSTLSLTKNDNGYSLESPEIRHRVEVIEPTAGDDPGDYLLLSGTCLFIFPFGNSKALFSIHKNYNPVKRKDNLSVDNLVDRLTPLFKKNKIDTAFICNFQKSADGGIFPLHNHIRLVSKNFRVLVGALVNPPEKQEWIDWTYALGVDLIWYELLCFNKNIHKKIFREHNYELTLDSLIHATTVFPRGCIFTTLVAGIEPEEETLKGIDFLTAKGITPFIVTDPVYPISLKSLLNMYEHLTRSLDKHKIKPNSITALDHIITPTEFSRHFLKKSGKSKAIFKFLPERLIGSAVRNIYKIRRNLRVRETR